jgi:uncharacterized coiled-coil DUF342 family protein
VLILRQSRCLAEIATLKRERDRFRRERDEFRAILVAMREASDEFHTAVDARRAAEKVLIDMYRDLAIGHEREGTEGH